MDWLVVSQFERLFHKAACGALWNSKNFQTDNYRLAAGSDFSTAITTMIPKVYASMSIHSNVFPRITFAMVEPSKCSSPIMLKNCNVSMMYASISTPIAVCQMESLANDLRKQ